MQASHGVLAVQVVLEVVGDGAGRAHDHQVVGQLLRIHFAEVLPVPLPELVGALAGYVGVLLALAVADQTGQRLLHIRWYVGRVDDAPTGVAHILGMIAKAHAQFALLVQLDPLAAQLFLCWR